MPGIKKAIANELINTGKNLSEITRVSKEDLLRVKGVGEKAADIIYNVFNTV